jgi:hypothetical protein
MSARAFDFAQAEDGTRSRLATPVFLSSLAGAARDFLKECACIGEVCFVVDTEVEEGVGGEEVFLGRFAVLGGFLVRFGLQFMETGLRVLRIG